MSAACCPNDHVIFKVSPHKMGGGTCLSTGQICFFCFEIIFQEKSNINKFRIKYSGLISRFLVLIRNTHLSRFKLSRLIGNELIQMYESIVHKTTLQKKLMAGML